MCLYIGNKNGHVLKKDFVCFKRLNKEGTRYVTPSQGWEVKLDTLLIPDESEPQISECGYKYQVNGGAIHAYIDAHGQSSDDSSMLIKAIIPAGTRFWLQDDLTEVAAEKLQLTSEVIDPKNAISDLSELIETSGADIFLEDGTRHKLLAGDYDKSKVKGIFAYEDKVMLTEIFLEGTKFSENPLTGAPSGRQFSNYPDAEKDMKGEEGCTSLEKQFKDLYAIELCRKVGGYLPSLGELEKAFTNLEEINLSRKYLGLDLIPYGWFWTSSLQDESTIWCCSSSGNDWGYGWGHWDWGRGYVVSFLRSLEN